MADLKLRPATKSDARLIYEWRNDPVARMNYFNIDIVSYNEHMIWYCNTLKDSTKKIYILCNENENIGQVRFSIKDCVAEISYYISTKYRGKGMATLMLNLGEEELLKYYKKIILRAEVKKNNIPSICVFKKLKYYEVNNDKEINVFEKKISI